MNKRIDIIGQNGNDGDHYEVTTKGQRIRWVLSVISLTRFAIDYDYRERAREVIGLKWEEVFTLLRLHHITQQPFF